MGLDHDKIQKLSDANSILHQLTTLSILSDDLIQDVNDEKPIEQIFRKQAVLDQNIKEFRLVVINKKQLLEDAFEIETTQCSLFGAYSG